MASVARAWAGQVPDVARPWSRRQRVRAVLSWLPTLAFLALAVVLQLEDDPGFTSTAFTDWRERRLARRVLALPPS